MVKTDTNGNEVDEPETTTINVRVTERQLEEIDAAWKTEGFTSRSEFLRHAIRDATERPGASREMLATIAAEEFAMRAGESHAVSREEVLSSMDEE